MQIIELQMCSSVWHLLRRFKSLKKYSKTMEYPSYNIIILIVIVTATAAVNVNKWAVDRCAVLSGICSEDVNHGGNNSKLRNITRI